MRVDLIGVGRARANDTFQFKSWDDLYAEIRKHLVSHDVDIVWNEAQTEGVVIVGGFRPVGTVLLSEDLPPENI